MSTAADLLVAGSGVRQRNPPPALSDTTTTAGPDDVDSDLEDAQSRGFDGADTGEKPRKPKTFGRTPGGTGKCP